MYQNIKSELQIAVVLLLSIFALIALSLVVGGNVSSQIAAAQVLPTSTAPSRIPLTDQTLAAFGLATTTIHAANVLTFDIAVGKSIVGVNQVNSGDMVTYKITLTNLGNNPASGVIFYDAVPREFKNVSYAFSPGTGAISNGATISSDLMWFFANPIAVNQTVNVTVTGELTSARSVTVTNTAMITTYNPYAEVGSNPNSSQVSVGITGYDPNAVGPLYFPFIARFPTPTPTPTPERILIYEENFNGDRVWADGNFKDDDFDIDCELIDDDNRDQYWLDVQNGKKCIPPADDENGSHRTYGEFEVDAYDSGEDRSNAGFGLFINGAGGDDYYAFIIWPNHNIDGCSGEFGGGWELIRRKDGDSVTILGNREACNTVIKRDFGRDNTNRLRITHDTDRTLTVYVNDTQLGSIRDNADDHRTGEANGLYVQALDEDILIKYDNWRVYRIP